MFLDRGCISFPIISTLINFLSQINVMEVERYLKVEELSFSARCQAEPKSEAELTPGQWCYAAQCNVRHSGLLSPACTDTLS